MSGRRAARAEGGAPAPVATARIVELTAELRAHWLAWQAIAEQYRLRIMETAWRLREACGSDEAFRAHCARLDWMPAERRAELPAMVATWAVARRARSLREAAEAQPSQAIRLVSESIEAGLDLEDETDEEVVELLSLGPAARRRRLRELIERAGRAEKLLDGMERAGMLAAEDEAPAKDEAAAVVALGAAAAERALRDEALPALRRAREALAGGGAGAKRRERIAALADAASGVLAEIDEWCAGGGA